MSVPPERTKKLGAFVAEQFCDEVYDYVDDNLAEAMDEMERELLTAALQARVGTSKEREGDSNNNSGIESTVKTCCDNVQKHLQKEFDRNLDIFDRYVKKNVSAATKAQAKSNSKPAGASATVVAGAASTDVGGETGMRARASVASDGGVSKSGSRVVESGEGVGDTKGAGGSGSEWGFEVDEGAPPKRLQEEQELDVEIQRLRKRRREGLRRCAAMLRKGAREAAVLKDVNEYVEALQMGVSSSFDDNGLTPVPAKVQEAVQSSAEMRVVANRALELTTRLERQVQQEGAATGEGAGNVTSGTAAAAPSVAAAPPPRDLQAVYQRSREHQVDTGGIGVAEYAALEARLRR